MEKALVKGLGPHIVFGCPNVDEHSILLKGEDPMFKQTGEYILFKAGRAIQDVLQNLPIEYVDSAINETRLLNPQFFAEANDAILPVDIYRAVSRGIQDPAHSDACPTAIRSMEPDQLLEIQFKERVAVHNDEFSS